MTLQISIIAIILALPFYWLAFLGLRRLWRKTEGARGRWALLLLAPVVLVLPFADELWIAWHFAQACKEAGVTVYRKVEVEGFFDDTMPSGFELIERYGYQHMEHRASDARGIERVEIIDGRWRRTILDRPTARYHYRRAHKETWAPAGFQIGRLEYQVIDSQTGEILGREVKYERFPGFVEGLWIRFLGSGQTICEGGAPRPPELRHLLYHYVVIPKKPN